MFISRQTTLTGSILCQWNLGCGKKASGCAPLKKHNLFAFGTRFKNSRSGMRVLNGSFFPIIQSRCISWAWTLKPFPPNKKILRALILLGSKWWMKPPESWSSLFWVKQQRFWPPPGLWGKLGFPSRILFVSERKRFWPLTSFSVVLLTEVQEDLEKLLKNSTWHSGSFLQGAKKRIGKLLEPKTTKILLDGLLFFFCGLSRHSHREENLWRTLLRYHAQQQRPSAGATHQAAQAAQVVLALISLGRKIVPELHGDRSKEWCGVWM